MSGTKLYTLLICLTVGGYAWLGWNIVDYNDHSATPSVCLFKTVTHLPCPSCGTTRALVLLTHGEVEESVMTNPFGMLLAMLLVVVPLWILLDILRKRDSFLRWYVMMERILAKNKWASVPAIVLVAANWFWNISKGL